MADIVPFPIETGTIADAEDSLSNDRFLLNEGLELVADFRAIDDQAVRDSIRALVKSMARSSRRNTELR